MNNDYVKKQETPICDNQPNNKIEEHNKSTHL